MAQSAECWQVHVDMSGFTYSFSNKASFMFMKVLCNHLYSIYYLLGKLLLDMCKYIT